MANKQHIKIFSHNDLDGFGAPVLLKTLQPYLFKNATFDLTTCSAGNLDRELSYWFRQPSLHQYTDVFIADMTPDSDYSFQQLEQHFPNHWLIFDHHESKEKLRQKYRQNCIIPTNTDINPSATSLVWDWVSQNVNFSNIPSKRQNDLHYLVELIRAYDTWDWKNDPNMDSATRLAADELNQLFWFYPLSRSEMFVTEVFGTSWEQYRQNNSLLINTLNGRRQRYLDKHLKSVLTFELDGHSFGIVYASDYKSEIAHALLKNHPVDAALVIDNRSISLRSNGKLDVASFSEKYFNGGGHSDSAGGTLEFNPVETGEQAVIDALKHQFEINKKLEKQEKEESSSTFADNLDPEMAAKLASLFNNN